MAKAKVYSLESLEKKDIKGFKAVDYDIELTREQYDVLMEMLNQHSFAGQLTSDASEEDRKEANRKDLVLVQLQNLFGV